MREAANGQKICKQILAETGVAIRIISGKEEARTIFANNSWSHLPKESAWLFVDVGGGSTEITIYANGKSVSRSFGIGTIRLLENLVHKSRWREMKAWIQDHTRHYASIDAVAAAATSTRSSSWPNAPTAGRSPGAR